MDQAMTNLSRRGLLGGFIGLVAAPAIVRASSLMTIKPIRDPISMLWPNGQWFLVKGLDQFGRPMEEMVPFPGKSDNVFRVVHSIGV